MIRIDEYITFSSCNNIILPSHKNITVNNKKGFYIWIFDGNNTGIGEISLLKGVHKESYDEVNKYLYNLNNDNIQNSIGLVPVAFGIDSAFYDLKYSLQNNKYNIKYAHLINNNSLSSNIKNNNCIKLKICKQSLNNEIKLIEKYYNNNIIRLDANQNCSYEMLQILENKFPKIQFIEEPLKIHETLLYNNSIPIALDESIIDINEAKFKEYCSKVDYIILKPSTIGSYKNIYNYIKICKELKKHIIISSTFETNIGLTSMKYIINNNNLINNYHGLGTLHFLDKLKIKTRFQTKYGCLYFNKYYIVSADISKKELVDNHSFNIDKYLGLLTNKIYTRIIINNNSDNFIVFIHGAGVDGNIWNNIINKLNYNIIIIDLPSHGRTNIKWISWENTVTMVQSLLKSYNFNKCLIIGHSLGGYIAYNLNLNGNYILLDPVLSNNPKSPPWIEIIKKRKKWEYNNFINTKPFNTLPQNIIDKLSELNDWPCDPIDEYNIYLQYSKTPPITNDKTTNKNIIIYTCKYNSPTLFIPNNYKSKSCVKYHFSWFDDNNIILDIINNSL